SVRHDCVTFNHTGCAHETSAARSPSRLFLRLSRIRAPRVAIDAHQLSACTRGVSHRSPDGRLEAVDRGSLPAASLRVQQTRVRATHDSPAFRGAADVLQIPRAAARAEGESAQGSATAEAREKAAPGADDETNRRAAWCAIACGKEQTRSAV